jgi:hypothetical protein
MNESGLKCSGYWILIWETGEVHTGVWWGDVRERDHLEEKKEYFEIFCSAPGCCSAQFGGHHIRGFPFACIVRQKWEFDVTGPLEYAYLNFLVIICDRYFVFGGSEKLCCIVIKNIQKLITIFYGRGGLVSSSIFLYSSFCIISFVDIL